jgi:hypothetical protein
MLELDSEEWGHLRDAYGSAKDLPRELANPETLLVDGDPADLWGRLCHQGDAYSASYAAVPYLLEAARAGKSWSAVALIAAIEVSRREGRGADVPLSCAESYFEAIRTLPEKLAPLIMTSMTEVESRAVLAAMASSAGQTKIARVLLEYSIDELTGILNE